MSHPERNEPRHVAIEDLLRLKRAERPSPEFWHRFERELRAKQLAAIVERRPWWISLRLPHAARCLARFQVPVGAAAALALSFVVVREYRPAAPVVANAPVVESVSERAPVSAVKSPSIYDRSSSAVSAVSAVLEGPGSQSPVRGALGLSVEGPAAVGPGELMGLIPWAPQIGSNAEPREPAALGELSPVQFVTLVNPGRDHDFQGRVEIQPVVMPRRLAGADTVAPLPVASSRELRRDRILANLLAADGSGERSRLVQGREVIASSLDDDRLYDSVRRVGMGGDRLTLKF